MESLNPTPTPAHPLVKCLAKEMGSGRGSESAPPPPLLISGGPK